MPAESARFHESNLWATPIRDLGLTIEGTPLEPILDEFEEELRRAGTHAAPAALLPLHRVGRALRDGRDRHPVLPGAARPDRAARRAHRPRRGLRPGATSCATCATRWATSSTTPTGSTSRRSGSSSFGSITQPYAEEYRPEPFSRALRAPPAGLVRAEAPGRGLGGDLRGVDDAGARLAQASTAAGRRRWPSSGTATGRWRRCATATRWSPTRARRGRRRARRTRWSSTTATDGDRPRRGCRRASTARCARSSRTSADRGRAERAARARGRALIRRLERDLLANVYRWTGHFPERTRRAAPHLADRAERAAAGLPGGPRGARRRSALTTLVTALAMNHVQRGSYLP